MGLSVCLMGYLTACLSVCQSVGLSVCLPICQPASQGVDVSYLVAGGGWGDPWGGLGALCVCLCAHSLPGGHHQPPAWAAQQQQGGLGCCQEKGPGGLEASVGCPSLVFSALSGVLVV